MSADGLHEWLGATPQLDLSDPRLRITAQKLTQSRQTLPARAAAIQDFVRRLPYSASAQPARARASQVLMRGHGDAHAKAVLFIALCRAAGLPARVQFLRVRAEFLDGMLQGRPNTVTHAVAQVHVGDGWVSTDGYVVDPVLFAHAKQLLRDSDLESGWGIVRDASGHWDGRSPCLHQFRWEDVLLSYGVFDDVRQFLRSRERTGPGWLGRLWVLQRTWRLNRRIARLRSVRGVGRTLGIPA